MNLTESRHTNNIFVPGLAKPDRLLEERYTGSRFRENRLYSDQEVARLPDIAPEHPHYKEWRSRKKACRRLLHYLNVRKRGAGILEIGCGNGWLSAQLAAIPGSRVVGLDLNFSELKQAARVFHRQHNLKFIYGDFFSGVLHELTFDIIVFSASIQYFPSLRGVLYSAMQHLRNDGEIHILDSHLYRPNELEAARKQTKTYYTSLGLPEMAEYTFHPCTRDLSPFRCEYLYNPHSVWNRLLGNGDSLPWICVRSPRVY